MSQDLKAVVAGGNSFGLTACPFCNSGGDDAVERGGKLVRVFVFRSEPSAREYTMSGLCQQCQDGVFQHEV